MERGYIRNILHPWAGSALAMKSLLVELLAYGMSAI